MEEAFECDGRGSGLVTRWDCLHRRDLHESGEAHVCSGRQPPRPITSFQFQSRGQHAKGDRHPRRGAGRCARVQGAREGGGAPECRGEEEETVEPEVRMPGKQTRSKSSASKPRKSATKSKSVSSKSELLMLEVRNRREWRAWLKQHHASSAGIWLVFHKNHTGVKSILYEDTVREALCFGWIDSLIKRLDEDRYALKVTPRKPSSKWSAINRRRWQELKAANLLTPAGLAAAPTDNTYAPKPVIPTLPGYIAEALRANANAWA